MPLSQTIKKACPIIGFFGWGGDGVKPRRQAQSARDNKNNDKLTVKGHRVAKKGAAWWSIDIGSPAPVDGQSITRLHLQFIIAWLSEAALFTVQLKYTDHTCMYHWSLDSLMTVSLGPLHTQTQTDMTLLEPPRSRFLNPSVKQTEDLSKQSRDFAFPGCLYPTRAFFNPQLINAFPCDTFKGQRLDDLFSPSEQMCCALRYCLFKRFLSTFWTKKQMCYLTV